MRHILVETKGWTEISGVQDPIQHWQQHPDCLLWLDMDAGDEEADGALMRDRFGLHPLAVQDALRTRHPPKAERFDDYLFVLLRGLDAKTDDIEFGTIQIAAFAAPRFFLTRHTGPSPSTDRLFQRVRREPALMSRGSEWLALALTDLVVRRYVPILLALEPRIDELEDQIFTAPKDTDLIIEELSGYKSNLKRMRRIVAYHEQMVADLARDQGGLGERMTHELNDLSEQLNRSVTLADLYYELASDLINDYLALASHRLNQIFRVLTIITVIFVPLSFLAGIYGMNFENMPELHSRFGYYVLLGLMAAIVTLQLWFFRTRKWL